jgi:hypothetical protein
MFGEEARLDTRNLARLVVLWLVIAGSVGGGACGGETTDPGSGGRGSAGTGGIVTSSGGRAGSGGSGGIPGSGGSPVDAGDPSACSVQSDCAWGDIDREILSATDCPCRYGCPFVPLSRSTLDRRNAQYSALCSPMYDGQGHPCGIDDCISPPVLLCVQGECLPAE